MSLSAALAGMGTPGPMTPPTRLLTAVAMLPAGLDAYLADHAVAFDAVDAEFGFIQISRFRPTSPTDVDAWSALLRWLVAELLAWRAAGDPHGSHLLALLVLTRTMRPLGPVWASLAPMVAGNVELASGLCAIPQLRQTQLASGPGAPEWERQAVDEFLLADREMAWDRLEEASRPIMDAFVPSWIVGEATGALAALDPTRLEICCRSLPSFLDVANSIQDLSADETARLAASTTSDRVRFSAVARLTTTGAGPLATSVEPEVVRALVNAARDPERWQVWMRTIAPYPIRYPRIQSPLGLALAQAPAHARDAYVATVGMADIAGARGLVSTCFEAFRGAASLPDRQMLWKGVYQRWRAWNFADAGTLLVPQPSAVDLALVGYGIEFLSLADLTALVAEFDCEFDAVETKWHGLLADCISARNQAASRLAPFTYAQQAITVQGASWLPPTSPQLPARARSGYLDAKFRVT